MTWPGSPRWSAASSGAAANGCWAGEIDHDPFLPVLLAAEHTTRLDVGTSIPISSNGSATTPHLMGLAGEEMIRWVISVKEFMRTTFEDNLIRGIPIKAGESVLLSYPLGTACTSVSARRRPAWR